MKKMLLFVLLMVFISAPALCAEEIQTQCTACDCSCPTHDPGLQLFQAPTDKDLINCATICGRVPGSLKYDGESLSVVCPCTGVGFDCAQPRGTKLIPWFLCDCPEFGDLENTEPLGVVIEIITPGVKFYSQASIHNPEIGIYGFETQEDYCDGPEASSNYVSLPYHFDDGDRRDVLITNARRNLFQHGQLYLGICLPAIEIDQRIVPLNTMIKIRISVYRNKYICGYACGSEICPVECVVAVLGCFKCSTCIRYLPHDPNWWTGLALTNMDTVNESLVVAAFMCGSGKQVKIINLEPGQVLTFTPEQIGVTLCGPAWAAFKATTNIQAVGFGGNETGVYSIMGGGCGCAQ